MNGKYGIFVLLAVASCVAAAETVTLAPPSGTTTNVLTYFVGDTALNVAGPGTVRLLNAANSHTGGTTLSGGTLALSGEFARGNSPVGAGTFTVEGGNLQGSGSFAGDIAGTGAFSILAPNGWAWTGSNSFSSAATVSSGTLEISGGDTVFNGGLAVADGAMVSVTDGTLGISTASGSGTCTIAIDGGTIQNVYIDPGANTNWFGWLQSTVGVSIGAEGAVFKGGTTAFYAQISTALSSSVEAGETAAGVTFDGGNWGLYASMAYEGPTVIKNGATVFLANAGYLPASSAVTVGKDSQLRNGGTVKSIASLTLEDGAIIGYYNKMLTVTGSVTLPSSAKVALYSNNNPKTSAKSADGTYDVLSVPAAYADALRAVSWSCATAINGKSYAFSVATSGDTATLSVTSSSITGTIGMAQGADSAATVSAGEYIYRESALYVGSGYITMNGGIIDAGGYNLLSYGTNGPGTVIINGGILDVKNVRLSSGPGVRTDLYLNEGGTLRAREMSVVEANEVEHAFHFNGGTLKPVASGDNYKYFPRYESALVGEKGITVDLSDWDLDGVSSWYRFSCMAHFDHDPECASADGGITVRGTQEGKAVFYFGAGLAGATLNGGVTVEAGGKISASDQALADDSVTLLPGSLYKAYNKSFAVAINSLTVGAANGTEPVALQTGTFATVPALVVEELSVLSPVEFSTAGYKTGEAVWDNEAAANPGVYTAIVYRTASPSLDTSLFRVPSKYAAGYALTAETVALTEGDYAGYTAVVMTVTTAAHDDLVLKENDTVTISSDAEYGDIYVGDLGVVGAPVLTLNSGNVKAGTFHLAYQPADGANSSEKHTVSYIQNGGSLTVNNIYSMYRGSNAQSGRVYAAITVNGGVLTCTGDALLGYNRTRSGYTTTFTVNEGGAVAIGGKLTLIHYSDKATSDSYSAPQGIIVMNGGTLDVAGDIDLTQRKNYSGYAVDGGIFMRGGVLSARNIIQTITETPVQRLVFDGGVYAPNAAAAGRTLSGLTAAHVSTNGAIVTTEKMPADATYTIAQNLLTDPGLDGISDGGFTKRGSGTLALSGANTFTGATRVEGGTLVASSADAISADVAVSDGAALDLGDSAVTVSTIAASGAVGCGTLTIAEALVLGGADSLLAVDGNLAFAAGSVIDFGLSAGSALPCEWIAVAAATGEVTVPGNVKARNAGDARIRCETAVVDGVIYVRPGIAGMRMILR